MNMTNQTNVVQCPNKGPGRYEGQAYPCIAVIAEAIANHGFANGSYGDADEDTAADFIEGPIEADTIRDVCEGEQFCQPCLAALEGAPGGVGLFTNGNGFRTAERYATKDAYVAAVKLAAAAEGEEYEGGDDE